MNTCPNCGHNGEGVYCSECGQPYKIKRITTSSLLYEVGHTFTHFDKGFGYTLKQLALYPGTMQKKYLAGARSRNQKPFSMFLICATITGFAFYFITWSEGLTHLDEVREHYFRHYFVIVQVLLLPFYSVVLWAFFYKNANYAEILVLLLYTISFSFLLLIPINFINTLPIDYIQTDILEIVLLGGYTVWTNLNFFNKQPAWIVAIKSFLSLLIGWYVSFLLSFQIIQWLI